MAAFCGTGRARQVTAASVAAHTQPAEHLSSSRHSYRLIAEQGTGGCEPIRNNPLPAYHPADQIGQQPNDGRLFRCCKFMAYFVITKAIRKESFSPVGASWTHNTDITLIGRPCSATELYSRCIFIDAGRHIFQRFDSPSKILKIHIYA